MKQIVIIRVIEWIYPKNLARNVLRKPPRHYRFSYTLEMQKCSRRSSQTIRTNARLIKFSRIDSGGLLAKSICISIKELHWVFPKSSNQFHTDMRPISTRLLSLG